jgi:hypothetical protein
VRWANGERGPDGLSQVKEASKVYGVTTLEHPAVNMIALERGKYYLGGKVEVRLVVVSRHRLVCCAYCAAHNARTYLAGKVEVAYQQTLATQRTTLAQ